MRVTADGKYLDPPGGGAPLVTAAPAPSGEMQEIAPGLLLGPRPADARAAREAHGRGALLAAPLSEDGAWDSTPADVVVAGIPAVPGSAAKEALRAGLRSAGRPLLADVRDPDADPESIVAAIDAGAAGAIVRTGDAEADRAIAARAQELEARRLDSAPLISVVVCNHNGARYLDRCLRALGALAYPRYEVILCDDGSTDDSVAIARSHGVRVVELDKVGLSRARNEGARAAQGEIVAYIDGDTEAEPRWLERTWRLLDRAGADATGGPNLPFPDAGFQERAVSAAPGSSTPVVDPDGTAILLAGCNMTFRRDALLDAGGFDDSFPGAYDDVIFCVRLAQRGGRLVFHPTASILHHRRDSLAGFLRQQYTWGLGTPRYESAPGAGEEEAPVVARRGLDLLKMDMRHVFTGPQARQLYLLTSSPLHVGLPLKALSALAVLSATALLPAALAGRLRTWAGASGGALAAVALTVLVRVPVFAAPRGPAGLAQRAATALLWVAQPAARRYGDLLAKRRD